MSALTNPVNKTTASIFPTLHDLPDLKVDMWNDHKMITEAHKPGCSLGTTIKIWGLANVGDSTAEYIRYPSTTMAGNTIIPPAQTPGDPA